MLCPVLLGVSKDHQKGKLVPDYGKRLFEIYYDAVAVCTNGLSMPEIDEFSFANKLNFGSEFDFGRG